VCCIIAWALSLIREKVKGKSKAMSELVKSLHHRSKQDDVGTHMSDRNHCQSGDSQKDRETAADQCFQRHR
jgi:hypothetical protein